MAKVTSKLQVTLPKAIADRFGIAAGDDIEWHVTGRTIHVVPAGARRSLEERLASFEESTKRQDVRNRVWRRTQRGRKPADGRGWRREELYTRGRTR